MSLIGSCIDNVSCEQVLVLCSVASISNLVNLVLISVVIIEITVGMQRTCSLQ